RSALRAVRPYLTEERDPFLRLRRLGVVIEPDRATVEKQRRVWMQHPRRDIQQSILAGDNNALRPAVEPARHPNRACEQANTGQGIENFADTFGVWRPVLLAIRIEKNRISGVVVDLGAHLALFDFAPLRFLPAPPRAAPTI